LSATVSGKVSFQSAMRLSTISNAGATRCAVGQHHVVEDVAEVGFVDAQQGLHRFGGQANLVPDQSVSIAQSAAQVDLLDAVGACNVEARMRSVSGSIGARLLCAAYNRSAAS
jgi:hypothetical protein